MHVEQVVQIPFFQGLPAEALRQVAAELDRARAGTRADSHVAA